MTRDMIFKGPAVRAKGAGEGLVTRSAGASHAMFHVRRFEGRKIEETLEDLHEFRDATTGMRTSDWVLQVCLVLSVWAERVGGERCVYVCVCVCVFVCVCLRLRLRACVRVRACAS